VRLGKRKERTPGHELFNYASGLEASIIQSATTEVLNYAYLDAEDLEPNFSLDLRSRLTG
jgi:hypothetical protein